jgi:hypothetical protein
MQGAAPERDASFLPEERNARVAIGPAYWLVLFRRLPASAPLTKRLA